MCVLDCSELVESLLDTMHQCGSDFTNTFRGLSRMRLSDRNVDDVKSYLLEQCASLDELYNVYQPHMPPQCVVVFYMCALTMVEPWLRHWSY